MDFQKRMDEIERELERKLRSAPNDGRKFLPGAKQIIINSMSEAYENALEATAKYLEGDDLL